MDNRVEFLEYLYQICEMGVTSTTSLLKKVESKENKITTLLEDELNEYKKLYKEVSDIFKSRGIKEPKAGVLTNIGVEMSMNMEIMKDNSDTKLAEMLIQGYTMGNLELKKKYNKYKTIMTKEEKDIADRIKMIQDKNIKKLKKYL